MLSHLNQPLTRRYRVGGGEGGQPRRQGVLLFVMAMLCSAVFVGLATVALH
ncbi:hypothetical protein J3R03_009388 [Actinoplanes couchii]|nr:hypothetical protein [Actinoplanes couchii]